MRLSRSRLRLVAALAIGGGAAVALALPAGAAVSVASQSPPVHVLTLGDTATLDARGAVVFAPVTVVCPPTGGGGGFLQVSVTEKVSGGIASGTTTVQVQCDGTPQRLQVAVTPTQKPFKKGVAFGQAVIQLCDFTCQNVTDQHNIQIVRP